MFEKPSEVNDFWRSYQNAVLEAGVPKKTAEWYAHWAKKFESDAEIGPPARMGKPTPRRAKGDVLKLPQRF